MELQTCEYGPVAGGRPEQIVVLLHGLGANGQDLIGLAPDLAQALPDALFIAPDAPFPCDMAPHGRQWFSLQDWSFASMLAGIQAVNPVLNDFLDAVLARHGLDDARLALAGFSQGAMMSLYAGPRRAHPIAGILAYSGALIWEAESMDLSLNRVPVHLVHGGADQVVPVAARAMAEQTLKLAGFTVTGEVTPDLAHGIDAAGLRSGRDFLVRALAG